MRPFSGVSEGSTFPLWIVKLKARVVGPMMICTGLIFVIVGLLVEWNTLVFLQGSISTTGMIVSCEMSTSSTGTPGSASSTEECQPTFRFQTRAGRSVTVKDTSTSSDWSVGEAVTVNYHPNDPQDAIINPGTLWLFFVVFGSVFILVGLIIYLRWWLSRKAT
jgi:hypothetical protein